jgi:hypothetical protein
VPLLKTLSFFTPGDKRKEVPCFLSLESSQLVYHTPFYQLKEVSFLLGPPLFLPHKILEETIPCERHGGLWGF